MIFNCSVEEDSWVPWTARRSNQSILKEISPEYSLEGLMLKLKLQYFGHLMQRTDIGKDSDAGKGWRLEEKGMAEDEMVGCHHWLNGHEFDKLQELVMDRESWHATVHGVTKSWTWLSNWTELNWTEPMQETKRFSFSHLPSSMFLPVSAPNFSCITEELHYSSCIVGVGQGLLIIPVQQKEARTIPGKLRYISLLLWCHFLSLTKWLDFCKYPPTFLQLSFLPASALALIHFMGDRKIQVDTLLRARGKLWYYDKR